MVTFRSWPVEPLNGESGYITTSLLHCHFMSLIHYIRPQRLLGSPTPSLFFNPREGSRSYGWRMREFVEDLTFNLSKGLAVETSQFPPWTNLVGIGKAERSEAEIRAKFLKHYSRYQGSDAPGRANRWPLGWGQCITTVQARTFQFIIAATVSMTSFKRHRFSYPQLLSSKHLVTYHTRFSHMYMDSHTPTVTNRSLMLRVMVVCLTHILIRNNRSFLIIVP